MIDGQPPIRWAYFLDGPKKGQVWSDQGERVLLVPEPLRGTPLFDRPVAGGGLAALASRKGAPVMPPNIAVHEYREVGAANLVGNDGLSVRVRVMSTRAEPWPSLKAEDGGFREPYRGMVVKAIVGALWDAHMRQELGGGKAGD